MTKEDIEPPELRILPKRGSLHIREDSTNCEEIEEITED